MLEMAGPGLHDHIFWSELCRVGDPGDRRALIGPDLVRKGSEREKGLVREENG